MPKAMVTQTEPHLKWRPRAPPPPPCNAANSSCKSSDVNLLDSRAPAADFSFSLADDKQQQNLSANQNPQLLRESRLDIPIEEVFQDADDSSSSSSDATSVPSEEQARYNAALSRCTTVSLFHRGSLPSSSHASPAIIIMPPILIDSASTEQQEAPNPVGLEIVPYTLVLDALALQVWPMVAAALHNLHRQVTQETSPTLIIDEAGVVHASQNGPFVFEFQAERAQPNPTVTKGRKASVVNQKRKNMCLPEVISNSDARTPMTQKNVRRSLRRANVEGFHEVRIDKEPSKRCKNWLVQIDETTGQLGAVSVSVLQGWGLKCGMDPSDLTEDALMQAPSLEVPNDEEDI